MSKTFEVLRIFYKSFIGQSPIAIYQMGKVGSSTIYATLKQLNANPVYHVHFLRKSEIERMQKKYKDAGLSQVYPHLIQSKIIAGLVKNKILKWNIITIVRDPMAAKLSHLFHNPKVHHKYLFDKNGALDKERALAIAIEKINEIDLQTDFVYNWINDEFNNYLKINVFDFSFNKKKGFQVINTGGHVILIIQTESINNALVDAIKEMKISSKELCIQIANENKNQEFSEIYEYVKKNLMISEKKAREIYNCKYVHHFYTDDFVEDRIKFWTTRNK